MKDGQTFRQANEVPLGNPVRPMDRNRCRDKFKKCVRYSRLNITLDRLEQLLSSIEHLEKLPDVRELIDVMTLPKDK